jgi:hypothetical protein
LFKTYSPIDPKITEQAADPSEHDKRCEMPPPEKFKSKSAGNQGRFFIPVIDKILLQLTMDSRVAIDEKNSHYGQNFSINSGIIIYMYLKMRNLACMRVISHYKIQDFARKHAASKKPLEAWY